MDTTEQVPPHFHLLTETDAVPEILCSFRKLDSGQSPVTHSSLKEMGTHM
jgi:hypothetical protein